MHKVEEFIHMPIPASMFTAVCALLGGSAVVAAAAPSTGKAEPVKQATAPVSVGPETSAPESLVSAGNGPTATSDASPSDDGEVDAAGWPWSPELHASTKGKTKDGLWRMKVGVTRPDPKPGFTSTESTGATESSPSAAAPTPAASSTGDEDDEFAAFRAASEKVEAENAAAAASVPARKWTDADLSALCNQAAVKLGDPAPVKAIITAFTPEGETAHSRNIPEAKRAEFAAAIEAKAGIEFAG